jgi:hypothetical protein
MRKTLAILVLIMSFGVVKGSAQAPSMPIMTPTSGLQEVFYGKYHFYDPVSRDTLCMLVFNPITIYPPERFHNKAEEALYWKTVRDVKKTLPYAKLICSTLLETYDYLNTFKTEKEKKDYLKQFEKGIFAQYKPQMKHFTKNQGKLMIKLVNRETDQSSYDIVKAYLGTFRATFWDAFGHFFGANLRSGYNPDKNKQDAMIERICVRVEVGLL